MRIPQHISPTSLMAWGKNSEEYYLQYLSDFKPPKFEQTKAMAVGSAFDAYAKSYLHQTLFGTGHKDADQFKLDTIFTQQVEAPNRDFAFAAGKYCFDRYKESGALSDLMIDMRAAQTEPRFEFSVCGLVQASKGEVVLMGKPDCYFVNASGTKVILDWKVNGYMRQASPKAGYIKIRETWDPAQVMRTRQHNCAHKDAVPMIVCGMMVNVAKPMEIVDSDWATQLAIYAWLLGAEVGEPIIGAIDQLACDAKTAQPMIRVAQHRAMIGKEFQLSTFASAAELWEVIHSGHIFRDLSLADSQAKCEALDGKGRVWSNATTAEDKWLASITRG